jgi:guanylate kinase
LRSRGTETPESLARRLSAAAVELEQAQWFNLWVINDDLEQAWQELRAAYIAATLAPAGRPAFLNSLLKDWKHS